MNNNWQKHGLLIKYNYSFEIKMGDGVVLVATNKRILVLILAAIIVTMLTIFGILFENIQRYNIRTS